MGKRRPVADDLPAGRRARSTFDAGASLACRSPAYVSPVARVYRRLPPSPMLAPAACRPGPNVELTGRCVRVVRLVDVTASCPSAAEPLRHPSERYSTTRVAAVDRHQAHVDAMRPPRSRGWNGKREEEHPAPGPQLRRARGCRGSGLRREGGRSTSDARAPALLGHVSVSGLRCGAPIHHAPPCSSEANGRKPKLGVPVGLRGR